MSAARSPRPALAILLLGAALVAAEETPAPAADSAGAAAKAMQPAGVAFEVDKAHSHIGFSVRHLGISSVRGSFSDFDAQISADEATGRLTKVEGWVRTASVDTGIQGRDDHLRSDDFFGSELHNEMKLSTDSITWNGNAFSATAQLTIRDQTHPVQVMGELVGIQKGNFWGKQQVRAGWTATARIDRQKFGLSFNKLAEGVAVVGNEVTIQLEIEAFRNLAP